MASSAAGTNHRHKHFNEDGVEKEKIEGNWSHKHYHTHQYSQDYSLAYTYDHCHLHTHGAAVPKHALIDMLPEQSAVFTEIVGLVGRPEYYQKNFEQLFAERVMLSKVQKLADQRGWTLDINGQTHTLSNNEAEAILVEIQ